MARIKHVPAEVPTTALIPEDKSSLVVQPGIKVPVTEHRQVGSVFITDGPLHEPPYSRCVFDSVVKDPVI